MNVKTRIRALQTPVAFFLAILLLFSLAGLYAYAEGDSPETGAESTEAAEAALPDGQFYTEENGGGFFNKILYWREAGGLVNDVFGEKHEGTVNGHAAFGVSVAWAPYILTYVLMIVVSYVIGSLNFGVIVSKKLYKEDVRSHGSGNAGMTNVLRVYGKKAAVMTFLGDFLKGAFCAFVGSLLAGNGCGYVALLFCMIGHAFPVFFKFKGGKAVAATFGGLTALEPLAALILFAVFVIIVLGTKYVSLGSIIAAALIPLIVNAFWRVGLVHRITYSSDYAVVTICTVLYACFIVWLHRANMKRLAEGKENKTYILKKKEKN